MSTTNILPVASGALLSPAPVLSRGAKAARDFEAHLISSLLESLEKTFATVPGDPGIPGADDYNYMASSALGSALADAGGFGIAAMISRNMQAHSSDY